MKIHIVAIAYDGNVSAIARTDLGQLIEDLIDNHGDPESSYQYTETPEGAEKVVQQIEEETGYALSFQTQEV